MNQLPSWIFENLGKMVTLKKPYQDGVVSWPAGTHLFLNSIQSGHGNPYVTLSPVRDLTYEENFTADDIEPYKGGGVILTVKG